MSPVFDCTAATGDGAQGADPAAIERAITEAVATIRRGGLVVVPTDTVYGVGADAFDANAVSNLLAAKGRGREMPPPVLIADVVTVDGLAVEVREYARALMRRFWPGPLTLVLKSQPSLMWDLGETNGTVAIRMPAHELALAVLSQTGPLAVTSANRTGRPAALTVLDAATQLGSAVETYLDAGPAATSLASTIVDCTRAEPLILRPGPITYAQIEEVLASMAPTDVANLKVDATASPPVS